MDEAAATRAGAGDAVRRDGKSAAAFRTTGEVAEALDLPAHVLRFWESKFPQVRPLKRSGGRRYYRPQDVDLLRRIRECLYQQGYTIRGVQKLLRDGATAAEGPALWPVDRHDASEPSAPDAGADMPEPANGPAPSRQALREALEAVRGELLAIRAMLDGLIQS